MMLSRVDSEAVMALHSRGLSQMKIASTTGVNRWNIRCVLRERGISGRNYKYFTELTEYQKNVLVGTLLGDGNLHVNKHGRNPYLGWGHGPNQRDYLVWKAKQFGKLFNKNEPSVYVDKDGDVLYQLSSRCHPLLTGYYDLFYSRPDSECTKHIHKKRITPEILDRVTDQALAIWWCDDGSVERNSRRSSGSRDAIKIYLGGMAGSDYELVESWFCDRGYRTTRNSWMTDGNKVVLRFSVDSTETLMEKILPYIPVCMYPKVGSLFRRGDELYHG